MLFLPQLTQTTSVGQLENGAHGQMGTCSNNGACKSELGYIVSGQNDESNGVSLLVISNMLSHDEYVFMCKQWYEEI